MADAVVVTKQLAGTVKSHITDILHAPVTITDRQGIVLESTDQQRIGQPFPQDENVHLRVPFEYHSQLGDLIIGEPTNGETISPRLAQALVQLVVGQITSVDHVPHDTRPDHKDRFIYDLLHRMFQDESAILREAKLLGLNLSLPRAVILIDAADYILARSDTPSSNTASVDTRQRAQSMINSIVHFFALPNDMICAYIGDGEIVVLKATDTRSLQDWAEQADASETPSWTNLNALKRAGAALLSHLQHDTGTTIRIGLGRYHPGLQGPARSYRDARAALALGRRFDGQNQVHCLDQLGIAAFVGVSDEQTKIELSTHLLSPLSHNPELIDTLNVFFAQNCCPSATSRQLSIHRNTLSHRLDKITALTGLDPRNFDEAVQIRLALLLHDFSKTR